MGKTVAFIVLSVFLCTVSVHCPAQRVQNNEQSSGELSPLSGFTSYTGSGATLMNKKELHNSKTNILQISADDTVKVAAGGTKMLTKTDFLQKIWNYEVSPRQWIFLGEKPAIIDFYADWCGPCKIAAPILEELSNEFAGQIEVYKIDTQREQELAAVFGISSIPAFLYIPKSGKPAMTMGIARTKEDTRRMFIDNINNFLLRGKSHFLSEKDH
jgi:thioredoxin 1